jgi:hypothetical protein
VGGIISGLANRVIDPAGGCGGGVMVAVANDCGCCIRGSLAAEIPAKSFCSGDDWIPSPEFPPIIIAVDDAAPAAAAPSDDDAMSQPIPPSWDDDDMTATNAHTLKNCTTRCCIGIQPPINQLITEICNQQTNNLDTFTLNTKVLRKGTNRWG